MKQQTKAYLDVLIANPKLDQTDAYLKTHEIAASPTKNMRERAGDNASRLIKRPASQLYLKKHRQLAKETQIEVLENARRNKDSVAWQRLASDAAEKVLDRTDGKPTVKQEISTTNLNLNIEASEGLNSQFADFLKQL